MNSAAKIFKSAHRFLLYPADGCYYLFTAKQLGSATSSTPTAGLRCVRPDGSMTQPRIAWTRDLLQKQTLRPMAEFPRQLRMLCTAEDAPRQEDPALRGLLSAARDIVLMKEPSLAQILRKRGFDYEAGRVDALTAAFEALPAALTQETNPDETKTP